MPDNMLNACLKWRPRDKSEATSGWLDPSPSVKPNIVRVILPFHPAIYGLQIALTKFIAKWRSILPFNLRVQAVYSKGGQHLLQTLQHLQ